MTRRTLPQSQTLATGRPAASQPSSQASSSLGADQRAATAFPSQTTTWKDIQTEDLKELIRRLRAVGCPEETIQDLVLAEVNRRYQARNRELWPEQFRAKPFWESTRSGDPAEMKKNRTVMRQRRDLDQEKSVLLTALFGVDPEKERRKAAGLNDYQNWTDARVSFLPESKREAVTRFLEDFEDKIQDFYARNLATFHSLLPPLVVTRRVLTPAT